MMIERDPDRYIENLRRWRGRDVEDLSLGFLRKQFQQDIERPHKQIGPLGKLWRELVPANLVNQTALHGFRHGVLTVHVDNPAAHFQLGRLLRAGLEARIRQASKAPIRKIKLQVRPVGGGRRGGQRSGEE